MALALLSFDGASDGRYRFRFDLGRNRYYAYAVGGEGRVRRHGLTVLADPVFKSPLLGPLPEAARGRGMLEVSPEAFDAENRWIQLLSYRTDDLVGPAISEPIRVPQGAPTTDELPTLSFGATTMPSTLSRPMSSAAPPSRAAPIRFREVPPDHSQAMFLGALVGALPNLIPQVAPIIGNLLGGITGGARGGGGGGAPATGGGGGGGSLLTQLQGLLRDPEVGRLFTDLLNQLTGAAGGGAGGGVPGGPGGASSQAPAAPPAATQQGLPVSLSARVARMAGEGDRRAAYSEAKVAPALLAALPALAPLLQQVLSPETVQSIVNQPNQLTGTVINGLKDMARLGIESHEQDLRHLRELNPGVDDPALDQLLMSLGLTLSGRSPELDYRRVSSVSLRFQEAPTVALQGRERVAYRHGGPMAFPLVLDTPRPIRKGVVQLLIKDPDTLAVLEESKTRVEGLRAGPLPVSPALTAEQARGLEAGRDYLVCAALVWKNGKGQKRGTSVQQLVTVVNEYAFDRIDEGAEIVALDDPVRFRDFWHRVWQGRFSREHKRRELSIGYYYVLAPERDRTTRLEVELGRPRAEDGRKKASLRSGLEVSLADLDALLASVAPGATRLAPAELDALRSPEFVRRFNHVARHVATLRGRPDDDGAVWIYPEVRLQTVILSRAGEADAYGRVGAFDEHPITVPLPVAARVVGLRSGEDHGGESPFEGMKLLFDEKIGLAPAELRPRRRKARRAGRGRRAR